MLYLVDEIQGIQRPAVWKLLRFDAGLLAEDLITDLFSVSTHVWTLAEHELVCHHPNCEVVSSIGVIFTAQDLWGHVTWGSACVLEILLFKFSAYSEVGDSEVSLGIEDDVLGFDITMNYLVSVEVFEGYDQICKEEFRLYFSESSSSSDMISQISAVYVVHDEIDVLSVLKGIGHIDEKMVSNSSQKVSLVHYRADGLFEDDFGFVHFFHGEDLACFFGFDLPNFAESTFSDRADPLKLAETNLNSPLPRSRHLNAHGFKLVCGNISLFS